MTHLETDLKKLKADTVAMWTLVINQMSKASESLENFDKELAGEIMAIEKQIDAYELKLNMDCENILALFNPLANDLRFVLAVMRINIDLERIGDYARSIAKTVLNSDKRIEDEIIKKSKVIEMFDVAIEMITLTLEAFEKENYCNLRKIFMSDTILDNVNKNADEIITKLIIKNPDSIPGCLEMHATIKKLERAGDHTKNIAEEIVFYVDAKVLRHKKKKEKLDEIQ